MSFKELVSMDVAGIVVLENRAKKKVYIKPVTNILKYVSNVVSSINSRKHNCQELFTDRKKLTIHILETFSSTSFNDSKWSLNYWVNHYSKLGYTFYNAHKPLRLIVRLRVDYRYGCMVELANKGNKAFVVGVFSTMLEATNWVNEYYKDLDNIDVVFANNDETRKYYLDSSRNM